VVVQDDAASRVAEELVRAGEWDRVSLGLDYFDATLIRPAAWVIGARAVQRSILTALLQPTEELVALSRADDATGRLMLLEELKALPWSAVWDWYCYQKDVPVGAAWYDELKSYAATTLAGRI
jgi:L-rhamnose isomerase